VRLYTIICYCVGLIIKLIPYLGLFSAGELTSLLALVKILPILCLFLKSNDRPRDKCTKKCMVIDEINF